MKLGSGLKMLLSAKCLFVLEESLTIEFRPVAKYGLLVGVGDTLGVRYAHDLLKREQVSVLLLHFEVKVIDFILEDLEFTAHLLHALDVLLLVLRAICEVDLLLLENHLLLQQ